jgi:hypothetical protein
MSPPPHEYTTSDSTASVRLECRSSPNCRRAAHTEVGRGGTCKQVEEEEEVVAGSSPVGNNLGGNSQVRRSLAGNSTERALDCAGSCSRTVQAIEAEAGGAFVPPGVLG